MSLKSLAIASVVLGLISGGNSAAWAQCNGKALNPVSDIAWNGIFPLRVAGSVMSAGSSLPDNTSGTGSVVCMCSKSDGTGTFMGLEIDFWDITYMAEIVKDAYCSPTLGKSLAGEKSGNSLKKANGTTTQDIKSPSTWDQTHWLMFPAFKLLGLMTDSQCLNNGDFAYASLSEVNPIYSDDYLADYTDPKVYLVANPIADIAAIPSYAMAQLPGGAFPAAYDAFYWAWWDSIYPLTGRMNRPYPLTVSAQLAARQVYGLTEDGAVLDYTQDVCEGKWQSIPKKSQWRFQIAKPVKGSPTIAGQSELLWGTSKNPPYYDGNFLWILFQKKRCCQKIKGSDSSSSGGS